MFPQVQISLILCVIAICDLFTDCYRQIIFDKESHVFAPNNNITSTCVGPHLIVEQGRNEYLLYLSNNMG
jgi:hypothetical protein